MAKLQINDILPSKELVKETLDREVKDLPAFPLVAMKVLQWVSEDSDSVSAISKVIESDPAVTIMVLRLVNSAYYGLQRRISSVKEAITYIGLSDLQRLTMQVALFEHIVRPEEVMLFDRTYFWQHCLSVAGLSVALAEEIGYPKPEEAYIAGLLHDIGKIIMDGYGRTSYGDFLNLIQKPDSLRIEEEKNIIGISHDDIGVFYCANWNIPDNLLFPIKLHHHRFEHLDLSDDQHKLVAIVSFSNFLAWTQGLGSSDLLRHPFFHPEVEKYIDIKAIDIQGILNRMDQEIKKTEEIYDFTFPTPDQFRIHLLQANIDLARFNTAYYYSKNQYGVPTGRLPSIAKSESLIHNAIKAIKKDFGFNRVYILKIVRSKQSLLLKSVMNKYKNQEDLPSIRIPVTQKSDRLLACLRYLKPVIIGPDSAWERTLLDQFKANRIGIIPISYNNRITGFLGLDNCMDRTPISIGDLKRIHPLTKELGMAFNRIKEQNESEKEENVDPLTNLYNKTWMKRLISKLISSANSGRGSFFVGMFEVDHFQVFYESFGMLAGENLLKMISGLLKKQSRSTDHLARFGNNCFMVALADLPTDKAALVCERIRFNIEKLGQQLIKKYPDHPVTVSIGMARCSPGIKDSMSLIKQAEIMLNKAKAKVKVKGGNQFKLNLAPIF
jgi:diguanylate cyclase (GGDEF)-like protein/putative nucleotidyltransferase with HDIG domain